MVLRSLLLAAPRLCAHSWCALLVLNFLGFWRRRLTALRHFVILHLSAPKACVMRFFVRKISILLKTKAGLVSVIKNTWTPTCQILRNQQAKFCINCFTWVKFFRLILSCVNCEDRCVFSLYLFLPLINKLAGVFPVVATLTLHIEIRDAVYLSQEFVPITFTTEHCSRLIHPADAVSFTRRKFAVSLERAH